MAVDEEADVNMKQQTTRQQNMKMVSRQMKVGQNFKVPHVMSPGLPNENMTVENAATLNNS